MFKLLKDALKLINNEHGWVQFIPAAIAAGSALAGALKKKKSASASPDMSELINQIKAGAERQKTLTTEATSKLQAGYKPYKTSIEQELGTSQEAARKRSAEFLSDIGKSTTVQGQQLSDILAQRVMQTQPQLQKQLREQLAATGGLQRGAAVRGAEGLTSQAAANIAAGQQDIALQQQEKLNQAKEQVFKLDEDLIQQNLGVTKDMLTKLFDTGRTDLINEALSLLGIEQATSEQLLDINKVGALGKYAQDISNAEGSNAAQEALLGGGLKGLASIDWTKLLGKKTS